MAGGLVTNAVCRGGHGVKRCHFTGFLCLKLLVWNDCAQLETEQPTLLRVVIVPVEAHGRSFARSGSLQSTCHAHVSESLSPRLALSMSATRVMWPVGRENVTEKMATVA